MLVKKQGNILNERVPVVATNVTKLLYHPYSVNMINI